MLFKIRKGKAPTTLTKMLDEYKTSRYNNNTRYGGSDGYWIPAYRTNAMANSFFISTIKKWNRLPSDIRETIEPVNSKSKLNKRYLSRQMPP